MSNFCSNCGAAQTGSSPFCTNCGARQAAASTAPTQPDPRPASPPPPPAYQPPPVAAYQPPPPAPANFSPQYTQPPANQQAFPQAPLPPAKKGSGLKILAFVLVFLVLAAAATVGGLYYVAHRLKEAVVDNAASVGVDLNSISSPATSSDTKIHTYKACDLLSQTDAAAMLGEPIERIEDQATTCLYYGPAGLSGKLAQEGTANLMKRLQQPGAQVSGNDVADSLSKLMGGLAAQAGATGTGAAAGSSGDIPLLTFVVAGEDGKAQMTALTATKAIFGGIAKGASNGSEGFGADIPGLGDRAVRLANLGLNVLQGNTLIRLVPGPVPGANDKTIAIARAILPKL